MKILLLLFLVPLVSCVNTGVVPLDSGTYMVAIKRPQVGFGPPDGIKASVYKKANTFCLKQEKTVETIKLETTNPGLAKSGNVSLIFKCIKST